VWERQHEYMENKRKFQWEIKGERSAPLKTTEWRESLSTQRALESVHNIFTLDTQKVHFICKFIFHSVVSFSFSRVAPHTFTTSTYVNLYEDYDDGNNSTTVSSKLKSVWRLNEKLYETIDFFLNEWHMRVRERATQ
jgi:hypothetical protein